MRKRTGAASLAILMMGAGEGAFAQNSTPVQLDTVEVQGDSGGGHTSPSVAETRKELERVPGGTTVIDRATIDSRVPRSLEDVLSFVPGVWAKSFAAGPEMAISVRGSGILQAGAQVSGLTILRDGIPINKAVGFVQPEQIDPFSLSHVAVYRGANALEYGSSTLGGAINFISPTGYTADKARIGVRVGSDGYFWPYMSSGQAFANGFDYFISLSHYRTEGFRESDDSTRTPYVTGNFGYRWDAQNETRIYYDWSKDRIGIPGALTKAQLEENPRQVTSPSAPGSFIRAPYARIAAKHTTDWGGDNRLDVSAYYMNSGTYELGMPATSFALDTVAKDYGATLRHNFHVPVFGYDNRITWGVIYSNGKDVEDNYYVYPPKRSPSEIFTYEGKNIAFYAQDQIRIAPRFSIIPGIQLSRNERVQRDLIVDAPPEFTIEKTYTGVSPKLGFLYEVNEELQLFSNINRSYEPPIAGFGPNFIGSNNKPLQAQEATTFEVGTRGRYAGFNFEVAAFHSKVKDELVTTQPIPNVLTFINTNLDTIHDGIEVGFDFTKQLGLFVYSDKVRFKVNYSFNHFTSDGGTFDGNKLPTLPDHLAEVELRYENGKGAYAAVFSRLASSAYVDFANSFKANGHATLGARVGYESTDGWSYFLEGQNLTNEAYANRISPTTNVDGLDTARLQPGLTRAVFAGIEKRW